MTLPDTTTPDAINGIYETVGGFVLLLHCRQLYKDKKVRGVSLWPTLFFFTWGIWNLYYYPHLNQWWSFAGGIGLVCANCLWSCMLVYYLWKEKRLPDPWVPLDQKMDA